MKKLLLIILSVICPISMQSSFMFRYTGKAFQTIKNNKFNTFLGASIIPSFYSLLEESENSLKITAQAEQIAQLQESVNNSVSKTYVACFALASLCLYHGYCKIEASFQNFKKKRPSMKVIFNNANTKEEVVTELKKYWYKQEDFETNEIPMKFNEKDMMFIFNHLA